MRDPINDLRRSYPLQNLLARSARGTELEFPLTTVATRYQRTIKSATLCLIVQAMPFLFLFDTRILVLMLTCRTRPVNPGWLDCFYARDCP